MDIWNKKNVVYVATDCDISNDPFIEKLCIQSLKQSEDSLC